MQLPEPDEFAEVVIPRVYRWSQLTLHVRNASQQKAFDIKRFYTGNGSRVEKFRDNFMIL